MKRTLFLAFCVASVVTSVAEPASAQRFWGRRALVVPAPILPAGPVWAFGPFGGVRVTPPVAPYGPVPPVAVVPTPAVPVPAEPVPAESVAIDVPHASVQVGPWGVEVNVPGFSYRSGMGIVDAPPGDVSVHKPAVGWSTDWVADLLEASHRLSASLARHPQGEVWIEYLKPARIAELVQPWQAQTSAGLSGEVIKELKGISNGFEGVVANRQLGWLRQVDGFEDTRLLLAMADASAGLKTEGSMSPSADASQPTPAPLVAAEDNGDATPDGTGSSILAPPTDEEVSTQSEVAPAAPEAETLPAPIAAPERIEI
ncbi:MAG: hypothetical protein AAGD07_20245 [Planctomycetota bacterium]